MNTPILQPPPIERLAWLQPGDRIGHRTVQSIGPISGKRSERITHNGKPAVRELRGSQLWIRTTDGIDWCERPTHRQRSLAELIEDTDAPQCIQGDSPCAPEFGSRMDMMQLEAGFRYYPNQALYLLDVAQSDGALLAAEVGTGKTALAIGLVEIHRPKRALIIAPQGVISPHKRKQDDEWVCDASQWQREFSKFAPWMQPQFITSQPSGDGVFLTYMQDALLNDGGWLKDVPPDYFDMIVVDEAHLVMNRRTHMGRALYRMQPRLRYALTATPMPANPKDCFALLRWLRPDVPIDITPTRETIITEDGKRIDVANPVEPFSPLLFGASLRHAIAPIRKRDIRPDMPPLHVHRVYVDAEPELTAEYQKIAKDFTLPTGDCGTIERVRLTKLRNLCASSSKKAATIAAFAMDDPSVVVSARTEQTSAIMRHFSGAEHLVARIDSLSDPKQHGSYSKAFQSGQLDALFMGIKCAYGHSFPDCDTLHVASLEWSFGSFDQACGRVYRINSQRPVHAYVYLLRDTIEERMFDSVCRQRSIVHRILFGETNDMTPSMAQATA